MPTTYNRLNPRIGWCDRCKQPSLIEPRDECRGGRLVEVSRCRGCGGEQERTIDILKVKEQGR